MVIRLLETAEQYLRKQCDTEKGITEKGQKGAEQFFFSALQLSWSG